MTQTIDFRQFLADYVASFHARNGLSRDWLGLQTAQEFDGSLATLLAPCCPTGSVTLRLYTRIIWGLPQRTVSQRIQE